MMRSTNIVYESEGIYEYIINPLYITYGYIEVLSYIVNIYTKDNILYKFIYLHFMTVCRFTLNQITRTTLVMLPIHSSIYGYHFCKHVSKHYVRVIVAMGCIC